MQQNKKDKLAMTSAGQDDSDAFSYEVIASSEMETPDSHTYLVTVEQQSNSQELEMVLEDPQNISNQEVISISKNVEMQEDLPASQISDRELIIFDQEDKKEYYRFFHDPPTRQQTGKVCQWDSFRGIVMKISHLKTSATVHTCLYCKEKFRCPQELRKHHQNHERIQIFHESNNPLSQNDSRHYDHSYNAKDTPTSKKDNYRYCYDLSSRTVYRKEKVASKHSDMRPKSFCGIQIKLSHVKIPNTVHACLHCQDIFESLEELRKHHLGHERVQIKNKCFQCRKVFSDVSILRNHLKTHVPKKRNKKVRHAKLTNHSQNLSCSYDHAYCATGFSLESKLLKEKNLQLFSNNYPPGIRTYSRCEKVSTHDAAEVSTEPPDLSFL